MPGTRSESSEDEIPLQDVADIGEGRMSDVTLPDYGTGTGDIEYLPSEAYATFRGRRRSNTADVRQGHSPRARGTRLDSMPLRSNTISGPSSARREPSPSPNQDGSSEGQAVDQMLMVHDGLNDALVGNDGDGSWLPIRRASQYRNSSQNRQYPVGSVGSNMGDDMVSLVHHERSESSVSHRSRGGRVPLTIDTEFLGDQLAAIETGDVFSAESPSASSVLSSNDSRSLARSLTSVVRRVVSSDRRSVQDSKPSPDTESMAISEQPEDYVYSPMESIPAESIANLSNDLKKESLPPLMGNSLAIFSGTNPIRQFTYRVIAHNAFDSFAFVFILIQTVIITYRAIHAIQDENDIWAHQWSNYVMLAVFVFFTLESFCKIIVSGLVLNPDVDMHQVLYNLIERVRFSSDIRREIIANESDEDDLQQFKGKMASEKVTERHSNESAADHMSRLAYLRSSWNRLDFFCVISYWIYFLISLTSPKNHDSAISVFRALSSLRILKWMKLTKGTATVLESIKIASPALANVAIFISAFWTLFAVVGIQAFSGSFRRQCVWVDPSHQDANYTNTLQFCGGHLDLDTGTHMPWVTSSGANGTTKAKGFICPAYSVCVELDENIYSNTVSFDNILQSLELVFVTLGMNGFSDLMNYTADSDHLIAALFFVSGVVILSWWMFNLFIAVISTSFAVAREEAERKKLKDPGLVSPQKVTFSGVDTSFRRLYLNIEPAFVLVIFIDFIAECCKSSSMSDRRRTVIEGMQYATTFILLFEIILRFTSYFPRWREFFLLRNATNYADLVLVIVTCVILIPPIQHSRIAYPWLSFFQVARVYRVVVATKFTRENWLKVLGKVYNLVDLVIFLLLMLYLCSLIASELLRGKIPEDYQGTPVTIRFHDLANSFAGIYQIMTTEGWAQLLYTVTATLSGTSLAWVSAIFICGWFFFANSVVVNLFIAAIQENFDLSEEEKKTQQIIAYSQSYKPTALSDGPTGMFDVFRNARRRSSVIPSQHAIRDFTIMNQLENEFLPKSNTLPWIEEGYSNSPGSIRSVFSFEFWKRKMTLKRQTNPFYYEPKFDQEDTQDIGKFIQKVLLAKTQHKKAREKFVNDHPTYNRTLFVFYPGNKIRNLCQKLVGPAHGTRYNGIDKDEKLSGTFSVFIMACVVALVILASVMTPYYQKNYYERHNCAEKSSYCITHSWMTYTDVGFAAIFTAEAIIKIIADGFIYSPNAYLLSTWNLIDFFVLVTLWIDVLAAFLNAGSGSRFLRAFKAFRALRLLHVNDTAKETFHNMIIVGLGKILGAAIVSLTLLLPFSLWGLNIFKGKFDQCTDTSVALLANCTGEFVSSSYDWNYLFPRSYTNPGYSFDSFFDSISILFQIISLEGWNNVLQSAQDVTGEGYSLQNNHSPYNGIFVYMFNFISIAFIATLFVTVIMQNYTIKTGVGFLTTQQRSFLEMQRILLQVRPSRTGRKPASAFRRFFYERAVARRGSWNRYVTVILTVQLVVLCSEYYESFRGLNIARDIIYLITSSLMVLYEIARLVGLPWTTYTQGFTWNNYKRNLWDILWFVLAGSTFILSLVTLPSQDETVDTVGTLKRLLFVAMTLLLIPKSNRLNRLFVAASASLPLIVSLLFTWFILFIGYAIAFNQIFGLTRTGANGSTNVNFRTIPKALLVLFRMSCGEGWNSIMYDYFIEPPSCVQNDNFLYSDCGSKPYAYVLFVSWNIISMYIFANMFISLIYESFSYVYQQSRSTEDGGPQCGQFVSRGTIRAYKDAWDLLDEHGTGYISKDKIGRLLRLLPYPLNVHIYDSPYKYREIIDRCKVSARQRGHGRLIADVDIDAIPVAISGIDVAQIQVARRQYERLYKEITKSDVLNHGIPFSAPLTIIPYYKIHNADSEAVSLDQYIIRRSQRKKVDEEIKRDVVQNFFRTIFARQRFLAKVGKVAQPRPVSKVPLPTIVIESDMNDVYESDYEYD